MLSCPATSCNASGDWVVPRFRVARGCQDVSSFAMGKRSTRIAKRDDFENAFRAVEEAIGTSLAKNPAAAALDRLGGLKGEKAQTPEVTSEEKAAIAPKAANARWKDNPT